jgi:hypothetical protein
MSLEFRPPDPQLLQAYLNRPQPAEVANQGIQQAMQSYLSMKQMEAKKQEEALGTYVKAFEAGGPQFASDIASRTGLKNPPTLPGKTAVQVAPGTVAGEPQTAGTTPLGTTQPVISPLIHASIQAGHGNPLGIQVPGATPAAQPNPYGINLPTNPLANAGDLLNQGKYGAGQLDKTLKLQEAASKANEQADKASENGPKSFDYAKAFSTSAGSPTAADPFIKIAQSEGRNTLTKREMDDIKNSINVSAQKGRGEYFSTMGNVKEQQLRDSLIKEARNTLDPFFQTGAGKEQANRLNSIGRAEPLANQMLSQDNAGDPHQMTELATAFDRVLKGGGASAQANIEHLLPKTAGVTLANWKEWWTNNPQGTGQQAFIKRTVDSLAREKTAIQGQVRSVAERSAPTLRVLKSQYPEDYNAVVDNYLNHSPEIMGPEPGSTSEDGSTGPHGATVNQNGHTYTWNSQTKQYE